LYYQEERIAYGVVYNVNSLRAAAVHFATMAVASLMETCHALAAATPYVSSTTANVALAAVAKVE
jgi:hypothetical protein